MVIELTFELLDIGKSGTFGAVLGRCTAIGGYAVDGGRRVESVAASGSERPAGRSEEVGCVSMATGSRPYAMAAWMQGIERVRVFQKRKPRLEAGVGVSWSLQRVVSFRSLELSANLCINPTSG